MDPYYRIPIRSLVLVSIVTMLLALLNIASTTAFNAILSLTTFAICVSYIIPITLLLIKKLKGHEIEYGPFNLGRAGLYINIFAVVYGVFVCMFLPFPPQEPVTAINMNYASPVFGAVLIFSVVYWFLQGRNKFTGPIREVDEVMEEK